jgi:hypothetical protein
LPEKCITRKSFKGLQTVICIAGTGNREGISFESNHTPAALDDTLAALKKMLVYRDVVQKVNEEYIRSATIAEAYRCEPAFKLQGSYRNMNKLTEKVSPLQNDDELE